MKVPFRQGDLVVYDPPYPVDGKWLRYKRNKQKFIVVRGDEENHTNIVVTYPHYAGFDRREIPYGKTYQLGVRSFYHAVPQQPSWEV